MEGWRIP